MESHNQQSALPFSADTKVIEARTAILLRNTSLYTTRNEISLWLLEHLFCPLTTSNYNEYQVLYLSGNTKPIWERKRKEPKEGYYTSPPTTVAVSPATEGTLTPPVISSQLLPLANNDTNNKMYILTPRTKFLAITKEQHMVFMVDLSSSLATIETSTGKVMMKNAYEVLENVILGLVQPFSLDITDGPPIMIEHTLHITVIAECSQFGSNMNVIPILAEYPTMRVLIQNVQVSISNVSCVLKVLHDAIDGFIMDLGKFRKKLTIKRSKLGYELDVRGDHSQAVEDNTSSSYSISTRDSQSQQQQSSKQNTTQTSTKEFNQQRSEASSNIKNSSSPSHHSRHHRHHSHHRPHHRRYSSGLLGNIPSANTSVTPNTTSATASVTSAASSSIVSHKRSTSKDHNKKDVWGVGKTGSTLSYILRAGLFALELVPKRGKRSIILITDGVVKSNVADETAIRQLTSEDVSCSVIQIGQATSFFPGLNFGFIPDNEILQFVTSATNGSFMFADDCLPILKDTANAPSNSPNFYHHKLLLNEISLDKVNTTRLMVRKNKKSDSVESEVNDEAHNVARNELAYQRVFPWDPFAAPINEDMGLLKYKEYFLPTECWHFMRARLRQGFILHSVSLFDEYSKSTVKSATNNNLQAANIAETADNFQKKERVVIVLILRWQPQITVEYRIKSLWTSFLRRYLKSISVNQEKMVHIPEEPSSEKIDSIFNCMRAPKAEILVRATTSFSHMLHNWDSFQRRTQMLAVQGAKTTMDLSSAPGFIKVGKMKRLLERLADSDSMLKQLLQFNQAEKSQHNNPEQSVQQLNHLAKFSTLWAKLDRSDIRAFNMCWYDEVSVNLIINQPPSLSDFMNFYMEDNIEYDETELTLSQMYAKLEKWSSFMSDDRQTYIKVLDSNEPLASHQSIENYNISPKHATPQFCELRVLRETDRLVCLKFMFFNMDASSRKLTVDTILNMLNCKQDDKAFAMDSGVSEPVYDAINTDQAFDASFSNIITMRPLSDLLLRDTLHLASRQNGDQDNKSTKPLWFINPAFILTGEFIVRNYLQQTTWHWDIQDVHNDIGSHNKALTPLIDLAFEYIVLNRTENKWNTLSFNKSFGHFYKEITTPNQSVYSAQYFIWKDNYKKTITTEVWVEPWSNENTFKPQEVLQNEVFEKDKSIITPLITFDILYAFGQSIFTTVGNALVDRLEQEDDFRNVTKWIQKSSLFNISSVLRLGSLLIATYSCPNYERHYHPVEAGDPSSVTSLTTNSSNTYTQQTYPILEHNNAFGNGRRNPTGTRTRTASRFSPLGSPLANSLHSLNSSTPLDWNSEKNTVCACPRPDSLFFNERDSISKLRPVLRDIALLHYYVEQSLFAIADRTLSLNKANGDDFYVNLIKDLIETSEMAATQSTLFVAQNFRDLRCFIKTFDPSAFVLILMPRLDAVVKGLSYFESKLNQDRQQHPLDRISLMIFECHRQISRNSSNPLNTSYQVKIQPINPAFSKEWIESLGSTLRPSLLRGQLLTTLPAEPLSDRTLRLMQSITQIYSRSFVKSVFTCLLHGRAVDSEDFEKVLEICDESNLDIDLTGYLNVQTLLNRRSRINEEELVSINQRFISVLGHYFEPVIISNSEWTNMYCYRPPFAKVGQKLGLSLSSGEKPSNLADVVMCAQNPLFVRLDCTLRKPLPDGTGFTEITFPLNTLPSLYVGKLDDGTPYNFEPKYIGTEYSPIASADGTTATLHLVCITLPQSEYDPPNTILSHLSDCPADNATQHQTSFLDDDKAHRARLPSLGQDKQDALVETEARLTWLFTEEIMHGLLRSGPITENVIRYIEAQLKKKNPFVDFPTTMFIPLAFVKNQKESRRIFFEEIEKQNNTPYRLIRVGDCFYASDNESEPMHISLRHNMDEEGYMFDGYGLNITTSIRRERQSDDDDRSNDEYCEGLGISILEPEISEENTRQIVKQEPVHPQLYWLLLIPQAHSVQIYFYSKVQQSVNRSDIIRITKSMVNEVMERTNRLILLQHLHDSRICSKYLIAPVEGEKQLYSSEEESSEEDEDPITGANDDLVDILSTSGEEASVSPPRKFVPGQFKCDIVFTKRFPLHWRLQPNAALNKLMTDTLLPFLVKNKPGMFVISHKNSVVYCLLSETNTMITDSAIEPSIYAAEDGLLSQSESIYGTSLINNPDNSILSTSHTRTRHPSYIYPKPSPQGSITSDRQQPSPKNSPSSTDIGTSASSPANGKKLSKQYEGRELVLEVYGVEADSYIIEGLVEMIESRITSEITLKEVQQFLIRNPTTRLSRADVDFILPVEREPTLQEQLCIPNLVGNMSLFLKILRKNILTYPSLHSLHSNYLASTVKRHHILRYGGCSGLGDSYHAKSEDTSKTGLAEEWPYLSLTFYYNYLNRAPGTYLPFEQRVGEGIAGICLTVTDDNGIVFSKTVFDNDTSTLNKRQRLTLKALKDCFSFDFEQANGHHGGYRLCIDIWTYSKLEVQHIYEVIYRSFKQSICDYLIETSISYIPPSISTMKSNLEDEFKMIASLLICILEQASKWESPSVRKFSRQINLAPWYFDGLVSQLKCDLQDIHASLDPIIARAQLSISLDGIFGDIDHAISTPNYRLYNPFEVFEKSFENTMLPEEDEINERYPKVRSRIKKSFAYLSRKGSSTEITQEEPLGKQRRACNQDEKKLHEVPTFDHKNYKYLIISGLPEVLSKYSQPSSRRFSTETTDLSQKSRGPLSSFEEELALFNRKDLSLRREDTASIHSRQESLASSTSKPLPGFISKHKGSEYRDTPNFHSFTLMTIDVSELTMYAYNCSDNFSDHVFNTMYKNTVLQETRHMTLNNILHQKLGLFYHTDKMSKIMAHNSGCISSLTPPSLVQSNSSASNLSTPLQHTALTQVQNISSNSSAKSPSLANTIVRLTQIDSSSSIPSIESTASSIEQRNSNPCSPKPNNQVIVNFESLKQLIKNTYEFNIRYKIQQQQGALDIMPFTTNSIFDIVDNARLCKTASKSTNGSTGDVIYSAARMADANTVLRDTYARPIELNKVPYSTDYLVRHGEPYLHMYLSRSKPLEAHEKAFKVYTKWAERYYGSGQTRTVDEMMTVPELQEILKASRLLHFCRTPIIFSEITAGPSLTSELNNALIDNFGKSEEMTAWYERLARTFMKEYASYLEGIGMHLIVYGPSNDQPDELETYLSQFTIADNYSVNSPVVYLLQVFEGGSIMCEARLTGAFVSVTLYTLHRRYGRLQYSPHSHQSLEVGRENFQNFMGECDQFKQRIHVNSFVFDFHLRYIQRSLDDVDLLPPSLDLLGMIKNIALIYDHPAIYARNRMIHGTYEMPVEDAQDSLVSWMFASGSKLGLRTLRRNGHPVACFVSSSDLSFDMHLAHKDTGTSLFRYTLLICPMDDDDEGNNSRQRCDSISTHQQGSFDMSSPNPIKKIIGREPHVNMHKVTLQYFILITYRGMDCCDSIEQSRKAWSEALKVRPRRYHNFLDEILEPESITMRDVFNAAKAKLSDMANKAIYYYRRENDWNKLYEITSSHPVNGTSPYELMDLASQFSPIDLRKIDPLLSKMLDLRGIDWNDLLDYLKLFYVGMSGEIYTAETRQLLLFINHIPAFFSIVYRPETVVTISINSREDRSGLYILDEEEKVAISQLATIISCYIWKQIK
ncbi:unnamed protein product [Rhizopus microsporus]